MKRKTRELFIKLVKKMNEGEYDASQILLAGGILFLMGIIIGIFTSPKNMMVGCCNGSFWSSIGGSQEGENKE